MNSTLTEKHLEAIGSNITAPDVLDISGLPQAAEACTAITLEAMDKFIGWVDDNFINAGRGKWRFEGVFKIYDTQELINLYLEQSPSA